MKIVLVSLPPGLVMASHYWVRMCLREAEERLAQYYRPPKQAWVPAKHLRSHNSPRSTQQWAV
jgi:hypothetical protein